MTATNTGATRVLAPRIIEIPIWLASGKSDRPEWIPTMLNQQHRIGQRVYQSRVAQMTHGYVDIALDYEIPSDSVAVFVWGIMPTKASEHTTVPRDSSAWVRAFWRWLVCFAPNRGEPRHGFLPEWVKGYRKAFRAGWRACERGKK